MKARAIEKSRFWHVLTSSGIAGLLFLGLSVDSQVAQAQSDEGVLEEIVVTSRRYEETLQDAPVAVGVMTMDDIVNNRLDRQDDIFSYTPGATYESFSKMQPVASIRGVIAPTPGNASSESSIQTVVDDVIITKDFMKSPPMYDMNRVEILRGPQGTAFGRNASVGLVHFVNNRPTIGSSARVQGTVGTDERYEINGHFNRAMSDTSAFRIAFNHSQEDGQTESLSTGDGLDGEENTAVRLSFLFEPSDTFSAYLKGEFSADRDEAPVRHGFFVDGAPWTCTTRAYVYGRGDFDPGLPPAPPPPGNAGAYGQTWPVDGAGNPACLDPFETDISPEARAGFPNADFHTDRDILTLAAHLTWNLDNDLTITSITGYMDGETDNLADIIGSPNDVGWQFVSNDGDMLSTELRIDNVASDSRVRWLAGVYLLTDEEKRVEQLLFQQRGERLGPFVPTTRETGGTNETDSWSIFGEISFDIGDRSTITYGGRFVNDDKEYLTGARGWGVNRQLTFIPGVTIPFEDGSPPLCTNIGPPAVCGSEANPAFFTNVVSDSWDDYISKLSWDFAINDNMNFYALYSEGFKSGTFQPDALNSAQAALIVNPETSTNFEVGLKGAADRYRYSITAYYMEVEDVQTINLVPAGAAFLGLISNIGEVESTGLEVDGAFLIGDNFVLAGNFAIIDAEMKNTPDPVDPTIDISGERPPGAPEWTFNVSGDYTIDLAGGSSLLLRADVRGRSDVFNQTSARTISPAPRLRPEVMDWGARIAWTNSNQNLTIAAWGRNLAEDWDITNFGPPSPAVTSFATGFRGKREYGVTATYDF